MNQPLVSIVLATYNGEKFLHQQLDSLINQTYKKIEIIIVDDCSTDKTIDIINEYANKFNYIKFYQQEKNVGYQKNFETAARLANGEFIAFCDQDDIWINNKIEILVSHLNDETGYYHDSEIFIGDEYYPKQKFSDTFKCVNLTNPLHWAIAGSLTLGHAMIIPKKIVKASLPIPDKFAHDVWVGFTATLFKGINYIDMPLVLYRQHQNNLYGAEKFQSTNNTERVYLKNYNYKVNWLCYKLSCMAKKCTELGYHKEAKILDDLATCTQKNGIKYCFKRFKIYYTYRHELLFYKKRNNFRKILYSIKMLFKKVS